MSSNKSVVIGTHDGTFHCDEALAIYLLKLLPRYKDAVVIRTRNLDILETCDIVVDVGRKYDPSNHRYDHHMKEFNETLSTIINKPEYNSTIKLSSAGLVYCHFGEEIIQLLLPEHTSEVREAVFRKVYYSLIQEVDAVDNGIPMFHSEPLYYISTGISSRVARLNPAWNDKTMDVSEQFQKAIKLVGEEFFTCVHDIVNIWWPSRCITEKALLKRFEVDESGEIIELEVAAPWQGHLVELEEKYKIAPLIKYVLFYDGRDNTYRVRAVPVKPQSNVCRVFLPECWGGLHNENLDVASGINGCVFVHSTRFIGGHTTRDGALEMARKSLQMRNSGHKRTLFWPMFGESNLVAKS